MQMTKTRESKPDHVGSTETRLAEARGKLFTSHVHCLPLLFACANHHAARRGTCDLLPLVQFLLWHFPNISCDCAVICPRFVRGSRCQAAHVLFRFRDTTPFLLIFCPDPESSYDFERADLLDHLQSLRLAMLDPLPPPPSWLSTWIKPYSEALYLPSLPYHIHEVLGAFIIYQTTQSIVSPILSKSLFPQIYANLSRRTRVNWDVHVVSLLQSVLINTAALWVMFTDQERKDMNSSAVERIYGYTGAAGMIQALATGYFIWDLVVSARYLKIFGPGILAHAVTALSVFSLGFVSSTLPVLILIAG